MIGSTAGGGWSTTGGTTASRIVVTGSTIGDASGSSSVVGSTSGGRPWSDPPGGGSVLSIEPVIGATTGSRAPVPLVVSPVGAGGSGGFPPPVASPMVVSAVCATVSTVVLVWSVTVVIVSAGATFGTLGVVSAGIVGVSVADPPDDGSLGVVFTVLGDVVVGVSDPPLPDVFDDVLDPSGVVLDDELDVLGVVLVVVHADREGAYA